MKSHNHHHPHSKLHIQYTETKQTIHKALRHEYPPAIFRLQLLIIHTGQNGLSIVTFRYHRPSDPTLALSWAFLANYKGSFKLAMFGKAAAIFSAPASPILLSPSLRSCKRDVMEYQCSEVVIK